MKKANLSKALMMSCVIVISAGRVFAQDWPGWRGDGRGISPEKNLLLKWSEDEGSSGKRPSPALAILLPSSGETVSLSPPPSLKIPASSRFEAECIWEATVTSQMSLDTRFA